MITITSQPTGIATVSSSPVPPVPVSDCWKFCLQPDAADAITTNGVKATVVVTFPGTCSIPANGTVLKIWGNDFTVQSGSDFTGTSFKVVTSGALTALNFANMISANLFFNVAVTIAVASVSTTWVCTITWNDCREQPRFVAEQMVFTAITGTGGSATYTNGTTPVYVDGYNIITRVGRYVDATSQFLPITKFVGINANKLCASVAAICVAYPEDVQSQLFTRLPDLTATSFTTAVEGGRSLMRLFSLEYGWVYQEDCQAKTGTIKKSNIILGINAAFDSEEPYGMRRYWYAHPDGLPSGISLPEFLTTQPKRIPLCLDSFAWLTLLNNYKVDYPTYNLRARFDLYKKGVGYFESFYKVIALSTDGNSPFQPINFNVSPAFVYANAPTLTSANLDYYEVLVSGWNNTNTSVLFNASESVTFAPEHCCEGTTDMYFLTPPGGIGTLVVEVDDIETIQEGQEIYLTTDCSASRTDAARYGGRTLANIRNYKQVAFTVRAPNTAEWQKWLSDFRRSPQHWIKMKDNGGTPIARKIILESGGAKIFVNGGGLEFKAVGYLADLATQQGIEP